MNLAYDDVADEPLLDDADLLLAELDDDLPDIVWDVPLVPERAAA